MIWEAAIGAVGVALSSTAGAIVGRKSKPEREANSAVLLTKAYGEFVDDLRRDVQDSRAHIHRQAEEIVALRGELTNVRLVRDEEMNALRAELVTVRQELADARTENQQLRTRMAQLERRDRAAQHH